MNSIESNEPIESIESIGSNQSSQSTQIESNQFNGSPLLTVYLREFGLQTIRHLCPCVRCSLARAAVLLLCRVAQTLRFPGFIGCPPSPFAFQALLCKIDALAAVGGACVLQTTCFLERFGPWRPRVQKSVVLYQIWCAPFEN